LIHKQKNGCCLGKSRQEYLSVLVGSTGDLSPALQAAEHDLDLVLSSKAALFALNGRQFAGH
jgi:hypothetical protein